MNQSLALVWDNNGTGRGDACQDDNGRLRMADSLVTEVLVSLFTDIDADPGDPVPQGVPRRGWWGNDYPVNGARALGSKLWILTYIRVNQTALVKAKAWAENALDWLVTRGRVRSVSVTVTRGGVGRIDMGVTVQLKTGQSLTIPVDLYFGGANGL